VSQVGSRQYHGARSNDPFYLVPLCSQYDSQLAHRERTSKRFYAGLPVRSADRPSVDDQKDLSGGVSLGLNRGNRSRVSREVLPENQWTIGVEVPLESSLGIQFANQHADTVYNFDTIDVDGKPEVALMCLKRMVGERGFEPPTPWSRTRFQIMLNFAGFC
jgi:hypothetical protein